MIELVYPGTTAEVIEPAAVRGGEMLPVVDANGLVVAQSSRESCHRERFMHPVVHLHVIDRMGNVFLQHRSPNKELLPNRWDTAVGGHVSYGEYAEEALHREAGEELGFYDFNPQLIDCYVFENDSEKELVFVYAAVGHFDINPDNYEVQEGRYWSPEEIDAAVGKKILTPQFESEYRRIKDKLLALL